MKKYIFIFCFYLPVLCNAQLPDHTYQENIRTIKLHKYGDIYSYPVLALGSTDMMELHFDDMDGGYKNYYYCFQLCNTDWTPANIQTYDFIRGFLTNRITNYRNSGLVQTRYTHYQAQLPEKYSIPTRAGNYLLKVFLDDDTSKLVFTRRFLVYNKKTNVSAQITQPFNADYFQTHQRIQVGVSTTEGQISAFSPQDLKIVVLQNYIWSGARVIDRPTFFRGNYYEYSDNENLTFPSGKEWRWVDIRSLRLMSDRVMHLKDDDPSGRIDVWVKTDGERSRQLYIYYRDINGLYTVENKDGNNPYWQSDYAWVHFTYAPPGNRQYPGQNVYLFGELTNYAQNENTKMVFNDTTGVYEKALYLKQGYYNYTYITSSGKSENGVAPVYTNTEGNYWETENNYLVLVYFRPFGGRSDELVGFANLNSVFQR